MNNLPSPSRLDWFSQARFGMFIHYGLFSLLERGEWVLNREGLPVDEYRQLQHRFTAERFDAEKLCDLAVSAGMRYIIFTTMHHEAFRLYDTSLSNFSSVKSPAGRDLTREIMLAARKRGLKVALYHSLNNWTDSPDAVDALEDEKKYERFIQATFERIRELNERYKPFDVMWYDGWWPFNAERWRAEAMNEMVRSIQGPDVLFNGRNGLPGDFGTPEGHMWAPNPWRPWEACITHNNSWGYHAGDHDWKSPRQIADMLATAASNRGNLVLNVGPRGDGSVPEPTIDALQTVGAWLDRGAREAIFDTDPFTYSLMERGHHRGDWSHHGPFTAKANNLYLIMRRWPGTSFSIAGLGARVERVTLVTSDQDVPFEQSGDRLTFKNLPKSDPDPVASVLRMTCDAPPEIYLTGGIRIPKVAHTPYDPCPSDIQH